ncbi:MAG: hypothetical protein ACYC10_20405 [Allorhizobium sp.]
MQRIGGLALAACMSTTLAIMPIGTDLKNPLNFTVSTALAGNGNGNGGGNGGGNGNGKSESRSTSGHGKSGSSVRDKSNAAKSDDAIATAFAKLFGTSKAGEKRAASRNTLMKTATASPKTSKSMLKAVIPTPKPKKQALVTEVMALEAETPRLKDSPVLAAKLGGLNSLNRNYHAYLNSNDPRMAAIRDYVVAYAQFELDNGIDAIPTDPALSDEALSAALLSAANKDISSVQQPDDMVVADPEVVAWAKDVLGVGPAVGKIDQVRDVMATEQPR